MDNEDVAVGEVPWHGNGSSDEGGNCGVVK
jgi:hypothetical protein